MSEMDEVKKLITEQNTIHQEYKAEVGKLEGKQAETSEALVKMDERFEKIQDVIVKAEKARAVEMEKKSISEDSIKMGELGQFYKELREVAGSTRQEANSLDLKSSKDFIAAFERKTQFNERDDASGGIFVMPTIDSLIDKLIREFSNVRAEASVVTIAGDKWERRVKKQTNGALRRGALTNFDDATKADKFGLVSIFVGDLFSIIPFTDNLEMDSMINIVSEILSGAVEDFAITEAAEFVSGDGVDGAMKGVLTYAEDSVGGSSFDKIERIVTGTSLKITFDDVYNLIYAPKSAYTPRSKMYANRLTQRTLRKLKDNDGQYLWQPSNQAGQPALIGGYPIIEMPELVAPDASDSFVAADQAIIFGDLASAYKIVDRLGVTVTRDNLTQYPDIVYKMKKRSGGGLVKGEAVKILKIKA